MECNTIHRAKGREADNIFLQTDVTPKILHEEQYGNTEEERRVWYTALTRTKKRLCLMDRVLELSTSLL